MILDKLTTAELLKKNRLVPFFTVWLSRRIQTELETIREECKGVSLTCPSRVEKVIVVMKFSDVIKVMTDLLLRRMMSVELRMFLA